MKKYLCPCGYEYNPETGDPENGVPAGTAWEDVPALSPNLSHMKGF